MTFLLALFKKLIFIPNISGQSQSSNVGSTRTPILCGSILFLKNWQMWEKSRFKFKLNANSNSHEIEIHMKFEFRCGGVGGSQ